MLANANTALIPRPLRLEIGEGVFPLMHSTRIAAPRNADAEALFVAEWLRDSLREATGLGLELGEAGAGAIELEMAAENWTLGQEGYQLAIEPSRTALRARSSEGFFRGAQTMRQLAPLALRGQCPAGAAYGFPCARIEDQPRFAWRGLMIDCSRHFRTVAFLKRWIDIMAYLKMNVLHWHLTNDQGWRIEIERYPKLTRVGAFVCREEEREGYYTKDEIRDIVEYAARRFVRVVPESCIPGHSLAAMLSYPELCCTGAPKWNAGHQKDLYCAGSEKTFEFLENVFGEIADLFPDPLTHVGGDEAPKDRWRECPRCQARIRAERLGGEEELQGYLNQRIGRFLADMGKRIVGWDETLDGGERLPKDAIVHWWRNRTRGEAPALEALRRGHEIVCSPNSFTYVSFPVNPNSQYIVERTLDLEKAYSYDYAFDGASAEERSRVLGIEACLWGETTLAREADQFAFPRLLACAETQWSPLQGKNFDEFEERVLRHYRRLDQLGIQYGAAYRTSSGARQALGEKK